mgnify:CR=1 FL=1
MSDLKARFEQAAKDVHALAERPDNDTLLREAQRMKPSRPLHRQSHIARRP